MLGTLKFVEGRFSGVSNTYGICVIYHRDQTGLLSASKGRFETFRIELQHSSGRGQAPDQCKLSCFC